NAANKSTALADERASTRTPTNRIENVASAALPAPRDTGIVTCPPVGGGAPRQSPRPATAPSRIAAIWVTEEALNRMNSDATAAIEARSRSGQSVRAFFFKQKAAYEIET